MNPKLLELNQIQLERKTLNPFIFSPKNQEILFEFLDNFFQFEDSLVLYSNIVVHALRILSYTKNKRVLAYIHNYLQMADCQLPEGTTLHELNPQIYNACIDSLYIISGPSYLNSYFQILYETTLDKEIALEYCKAFLMGQLKNFNGYEARKKYQIPINLKLEMLNSFKNFPHIVSYLAVQAIDLDFLPIITNFLKNNCHQIVDEEEISHEDSLIIEAWYLLKAISEKKEPTIKNYLQYVLNYEKNHRDFNNLYPKEGNVRKIASDELSIKKVQATWEIITKEFLTHFRLLSPQITNSNFGFDESENCNIIPFFK